MRLRRIEIENLKGIGARQAIDLQPITLLFGPNSVGKSTILQEMHYIREILEKRNIDPDVTIAGGLIASFRFRPGTPVALLSVVSLSEPSAK